MSADHGGRITRWEAVEGRASRLAEDLHSAGYREQAAELREILPDPPLTGDEHLRMLRFVLASIVESRSVPESLRLEAANIRNACEDLPAALGMQGTVWIAWIGVTYSCFWDSAPADGGWYEQGPLVRDLTVALRWAELRSRRIFVQPEGDPSKTYWAGEGDPPGEYPRLLSP